MKNVALFESHYRGRSWFLALNNICNLYVISSLKEEYNFFLQNGLPESKILNLRNFDPNIIEINDAINYLIAQEKKYNFNFLYYILMDRRMRLHEYSYVAKYLFFIHHNINIFFRKNNIECVIIEPTWTHELVSYFICKEHGIRYLAPVRDKIVPNSFYFFNSYLRDEFYIRKSKSKPTFSVQYSVEKVPPYFNYFSKRNKITFKKFVILLDLIRLNLFGYLNKNIHIGFFNQFINKVRSVFKNYYFSFFLRFADISKIDFPFILFTLHVQPEAGIDVIGAKYSNQLECIRQFASGMPMGYLLAVKEHPHDFGRRNNSFYNELKKIPNVVLISPYCKTSSIFKHKYLKLCVSVAGTSSLEAALQGIPALTFVKMYFNKLMITESFDPYNDKIINFLNKTINIKNIMEEYEKIHSNSFQGNCGDFKTDSNAISVNNIHLLKTAFSEAIEG